MKITKLPKHIEIDDNNIRLLDIYYEGYIKGELLNENVLGIKNGRMIIVFLTKPENVIMDCVGSYKIKRAFAYRPNGEQVPVDVAEKNDKINKIKSKFNESGQRFDEFNESGDDKSINQTLIKYTLKGKKITLNENNKRVRNYG